MPLSITEKLLAVARQTYQITDAGEILPASGDSTIDWLEVPHIFTAGALKIDAALVGQTLTEIIVAFRGTFPFDSPDRAQTILDWLSDCDALLVEGSGLPGLVHQGFLKALDALWPGMAPVIGALSEKNPAKPVHVIGHSKGGAVANLGARRLRTMLPPNVPVIVTTFAAPKPGDAAFQADYDRAIPHSVRFECQDDIVPHVPPSELFASVFADIPHIAERVKNLTLGYVPVGDLHFIDWDEQIINDSPVLRLRRFARLAELLMGFGYRTIVGDHGIDPASVYGRAPYS